jgi:hypothetical protein
MDVCLAVVKAEHAPTHMLLCSGRCMQHKQHWQVAVSQTWQQACRDGLRQKILIYHS